MRQSSWLFPAIETVHLLAMSTLLASIASLDLRLLGLAFRRIALIKVAARTLPLAWTAFSFQFLTGALLFASEAVHMERNPAFRLKMALIVAAGVQVLFFRLIVKPGRARSDNPLGPSWLERISGAFSLILWIAVVAAGRWIGFL